MTSKQLTLGDLPDVGLGGYLITDAFISPCGTYRWRLWRIWDGTAPLMVFVMMNPSTADASADDATVRRCVAFAKRDGFGGIVIVNVFGLRSRDPKALAKHPDPVGSENLRFLREATATNSNARRFVGMPTPDDQLVVAWGAPKGGKRLAHHYANAIACLVNQKPKCLGIIAGGHPQHPLFVRADAPLIDWPGLEVAA